MESRAPLAYSVTFVLLSPPISNPNVTEYAGTLLEVTVSPAALAR